LNFELENIVEGYRFWNGEAEGRSLAAGEREQKVDQ